MERVKQLKDLLYFYKNDREHIHNMIKRYTDQWVTVNQKIIELEEELENEEKNKSNIKTTI